MAQRIRLITRHPSAMLLGVQLVCVLGWPFLDHSTAGRATLGVLQMTGVALAVYAVRRTPALSWFVLVLGVPAMVFTLLEACWPHDDWIVLISAALHGPFYLYVSYAMLRYLFHDDIVTRDELFATAAAFTVVAWAFAYIFAATQVLWPGCFSGASGEDQSWFELLFLSFTTMTNTGLSDIAPVEAHARSLVMVEEFVGVFYIALVIARIVGLTMKPVNRA